MSPAAHRNCLSARTVLCALTCMPAFSHACLCSHVHACAFTCMPVLSRACLPADGAPLDADNSVFGLLHSWFLPAPPVNTASLVAVPRWWRPGDTHSSWHSGGGLP